MTLHIYNARLLDPAFAISALDEDGGLIGMAGFKTKEGALVAGSLSRLFLRRVFLVRR